MSTDEREADGTLRARFRDRVRQWREEAVLQAVSDLLVERGCLSLTMDDVAKRAGIAKGSLYLHTSTRNGLVEEVLDRWAAEVPEAADRASSQPGTVDQACDALFSPATGLKGTGAAFPCCLHQSPCPHAWIRRWTTILGTPGPSAEEPGMVGEAVQALASMPTARALLERGDLGAAKELVMRFLAGYQSWA